MENRRKKKRIIIFSIISFIVALLLAGVLYYIFKPDKGDKLDTLEVARGNVIQTLDKTASVSSSEKGDFALIDGVAVKKVNVKVGQIVNKGDVLATFDTTSLQKVVNEKQEAYNTAKSAYDKYLASASSATGQLAAVDSQIAALESKIAKLEKTIEQQKKENENKKPEDTTTEEKNEIEKLKEALNNLIDDTVLSSKLIQLILKNSESAQQVIDALKGVINSMGGISGSIDISDIQSSIASTMTGISKEQSDLIEAQLELAGLKTKKATLSVSADSSLESIYKKVVDSTYEAYIAAQNTVDSVSKGWIAKYDGIVSRVNIKEGQTYGTENSSKQSGFDISSLLSSVISGDIDMSALLSNVATDSESVLTVEYFPLTATFILGKTEVSKVQVGQKVDVFVNSEEAVTGTVVYKSAVANEGSSFDITSMLGGSSSSEGLEVRVEFDEYNSNMVIGFDVEISIKTDEVENTVVVPIESIQYENSKAYVFKYNAEENIITKTEVTIGLRDDRAYEITSGCDVGDIIVKSPSSTLQDGQKIRSNVIGTTVK